MTASPRLAAALVAAGCGLAVLMPAPAASAHPLGNATVNHFDGLHLYPDHITDRAIEDIAEIPTLQRTTQIIDRNHDGRLEADEAASYAASQCAALARSDRITVNGQRVAMTVTASSYSQRPGAIQLFIGRLVCDLSGAASLSHDAVLAIDDPWDGAGIGWHEITAVATAVELHRSPFPAHSISGELLHYPNNLLSSPIDVRSGSVATTPGSGASTYLAEKKLPVAGFALRALNHMANAFNALVGRKHVTVWIGLLAILLAMLLGAGHAFLPGHGKTIMAAYLVGRQGRLRDVVTVGATVTITHTAGVLILGLLLSATTAFAPTEAEQDLSIISGLTVVVVGLALLVSAIRRRGRPGILAATIDVDPDLEAVAAQADDRELVGAPVGQLGEPGHSHGSESAHPHSHSHNHSQGHSDSRTHSHGDGHDHDHAGGHHHHGGGEHSHGTGFSRGGLIGLGVFGGLVPSPSALLVLLATIALGRTVFGITLVLAYGLGMALALTAAGLLLVRLRDRLAKVLQGTRVARAERLALLLPVFTAVLIIVVGTGLTLRAVGGTI